MAAAQEATPGRIASRPRAEGAVPRAERILAFGMLSPALALVACLLVVPLGLLVFLSLKATKLGTLAQILRADTTLANYLRVTAAPEVWNSLWVSAQYVVIASAVAFVLGLATALLLNEHFPARRLFRTLLLLPWAVPGITATIAFLWIMQPSFGVLNFVLRTAGLQSVDLNWFGSPGTALLAVVVPTVWKTYPFFAIMLLAALQTIPGDLYEAASLDGATLWQRFRWVTWPSIRRYAVVALVFNAMYVFREFDFIYASTKGGPDHATDTVAIRIYNVAFESFDLASASALGVLTFVLVAACLSLFVRWQIRTDPTR